MPEITPGSFRNDEGNIIPSDEGNDGFINKQMEIEHKASSDKSKLINKLRKKVIITPQFARLLASIKTSTFINQEACNLRKIQAVIQLKDRLVTNADQVLAYIGSGIDWQFPVALGARVIDMVDDSFSADESASTRLLESVREFDPKAEIKKDDVSEVNFQVDLGQGPKKITLRLCPNEVSEYKPASQLYGVLEHLGPSKGYTDGTSPVLPNIARMISLNGFILNFDFNDIHPQYSPPQDSGLERIDSANFGVLRVTNTELLTQQAERSSQKKSDWWEKIPSPYK